MKHILVRWTAVYETVIPVSDDATPKQIEDEAACINIEVPGSAYQTDTWEVEKISNALKASYTDGRCPDCNLEIPETVCDGQECQNCEHVFSFPQ